LVVDDETDVAELFRQQVRHEAPGHLRSCISPIPVREARDKHAL
jgi:hypothetical protein